MKGSAKAPTGELPELRMKQQPVMTQQDQQDQSDLIAME
jgi:hypothetical protein